MAKQTYWNKWDIGTAAISAFVNSLLLIGVVMSITSHWPWWVIVLLTTGIPVLMHRFLYKTQKDGDQLTLRFPFHRTVIDLSKYDVIEEPFKSPRDGKRPNVSPNLYLYTIKEDDKDSRRIKSYVTSMDEPIIRLNPLNADDTDTASIYLNVSKSWMTNDKK